MNQENKPSLFQTLVKFRWPILIGVGLLYFMFSPKKNTTPNKTTQTQVETVYEPTQGVVTTLEQTGENEFKITDEKLVESKDQSRVIVNYQDGQRDTFAMNQVQDQSTTNDEEYRRYRYRPSFFSGIVYGGLLGYAYGGRSMSTPLSRSSYASESAYRSSSTQGTTRMRSTARKSTVRRTGTTGRTGYGSGRSTRSYGG